MNLRPTDYESVALPLSYFGAGAKVGPRHIFCKRAKRPEITNAATSASEINSLDFIKPLVANVLLCGGLTGAGNMIEQDPATLAEGQTQNGFSYDSNAATLLILTVKNAILNILTLTIYLFWAKTDVRRHLWNRTRFQNDPLEYTGVGKELFLGFLLILFVIILPLAIANEVLIQFFGPANSVQLLLLGFVLFLVGVARYRARRYRLSRTTWRGIRAAQTGAPWLYGLKTLGFMVLLPLTLGWSYPWQRIHLARFEMSNTLFGDRSFQFDGNAAALYRRFIRAWGAFVILTVIVIIGIILFFDVRTSGLDGESLTAPDGSAENGKALAGVFLIIITPYVVSLFVFAGYKVRVFGYFAASTKYEGLSFTFDGNTWNLIKLVLGNYFITLLTLGFGLPFA